MSTLKSKLSVKNDGTVKSKLDVHTMRRNSWLWFAIHLKWASPESRHIFLSSHFRVVTLCNAGVQMSANNVINNAAHQLMGSVLKTHNGLVSIAQLAHVLLILCSVHFIKVNLPMYARRRFLFVGNFIFGKSVKIIFVANCAFDKLRQHPLPPPIPKCWLKKQFPARWWFLAEERGRRNVFSATDFFISSCFTTILLFFCFSRGVPTQAWRHWHQFENCCLENKKKRSKKRFCLS
jgi:hypothetical protein